jgi:hypothetical protein
MTGQIEFYICSITNDETERKNIGIIDKRNETKGLTNCCHRNYVKKYYFHIHI